MTLPSKDLGLLKAGCASRKQNHAGWAKMSWLSCTLHNDIQDDLLHNLSKHQGQSDSPVVPWILPLTLVDFLTSSQLGPQEYQFLQQNSVRLTFSNLITVSEIH